MGNPKELFEKFKIRKDPNRLLTSYNPDKRDQSALTYRLYVKCSGAHCRIVLKMCWL